MNRRLHPNGWLLPEPAVPQDATTTTLRASDQDREQTAAHLQHAGVEGRLFAEELEDRLAAAFSATTYAELSALVSDLPAPVNRDRRRLVELVRLRPALVLALAAVSLIVLVLVAGALVLGIRHTSAAAAGQPRRPVISQSGPR
jgi:hypothetical protein